MDHGIRQSFIFYLVLRGADCGAISVITVRNPCTPHCFWCWRSSVRAMIWMLLEVEFLAIILVLVYVGAVMVLFLFVVMMLDINLTPLQGRLHPAVPAGRFGVALVMAWS